MASKADPSTTLLITVPLLDTKEEEASSLVAKDTRTTSRSDMAEDKVGDKVMVADRATAVVKVVEARAMVEAKDTVEARDMAEETLLVALNVS